MKRTTLRMIALAIKATFLRIRCSTVVEYGMPGHYVLEIKNSDFVEKHYLTIVSLSGIGNVYQVTHTIDEWRQEGSVQQYTHVKSETWYGAYDRNFRRLVDADFQRSVAFIPEERKVILENDMPITGVRKHFTATLNQVQ